MIKEYSFRLNKIFKINGNKLPFYKQKLRYLLKEYIILVCTNYF